MIISAAFGTKISRSRKSATQQVLLSASEAEIGRRFRRILRRGSDTMAAADRADNALCEGKRHFPRPTDERVHGSVVPSGFFSRKSRRPISARTCLGNLGYSSGFAGVK